MEGPRTVHNVPDEVHQCWTHWDNPLFYPRWSYFVWCIRSWWVHVTIWDGHDSFPLTKFFLLFQTSSVIYSCLDEPLILKKGQELFLTHWFQQIKIWNEAVDFSFQINWKLDKKSLSVANIPNLYWQQMQHLHEYYSSSWQPWNKGIGEILHPGRCWKGHHLTQHQKQTEHMWF